MRSLFRTALLALLLTLGQGASALDVAGVTFTPQVEVNGSKLDLNGAGVRYKAIFKVYAAGLYLGHKASTLEEVLKTPGPKRMSITMLRDIDAAELGKLFSRGMEDNMDRAAFVQLIPGIMRMSQIFSDHKRLVAGDSFSLDWIPGQG
ncbi:MAG: chalcone isomerase family protein, partial [Burkholderiales bacterium]|nr:chalcone isomerase family protein [Burkholderiales bacterium]